MGARLGFVERSLLKKIVRRLETRPRGAQFRIHPHEFRGSGDVVRAYLDTGGIIDLAEFKGLWCVVGVAETDWEPLPLGDRRPYSLGISDSTLIPTVAERFALEIDAFNVALAGMARDRAAAMDERIDTAERARVEEAGRAAFAVAEAAAMAERYAALRQSQTQAEAEEDEDEGFPLMDALIRHVDEFRPALPWKVPTDSSEDIILTIRDSPIVGVVGADSDTFYMDLGVAGQPSGHQAAYEDVPAWRIPDVIFDDILEYAETLRAAESEDLLPYLRFVRSWGIGINIPTPDWIDDIVEWEDGPSDTELNDDEVWR